jgi:PAS domain S-box-containing protein
MKGRVIKNEENEVIKMLGTSQDISELKKTEEQLKIFNLFERMLNEIYIFSERNFKVLYANEEALRNLGHTANLINNYTLFDILTDFKKTSFKKTITPLLNGTKDKIITFGSFKRKDGSIYPIELHLQLIEQNEKKVFLATVLDLTERKRTEQVLTASLKEKEILLKEVHHRLKNNLQIIYSLINLQSNSISDKNVLNIFKVSQNRIKSMALIHEKLYMQNNLSMVNFTEYLSDLASSLAYSYSIETSHIEFKLNTQQVLLNIDLAVSLGLCATELITNCFKYAFPERRRGEICLDLNFYGNHKMILSIKDNGIGLPDSFDFRNNDSLGLKLVSSLVEQHHGLLKIDTNGATTFILEIPFKDNMISPSLNFNREMEEKLFPAEKLPI